MSEAKAPLCHSMCPVWEEPPFPLLLRLGLLLVGVVPYYVCRPLSKLELVEMCLLWVRSFYFIYHNINVQLSYLVLPPCQSYGLGLCLFLSPWE